MPSSTRHEANDPRRAISRAEAHLRWLEFCLKHVTELLARGWGQVEDGACSSCGGAVVAPADAEGLAGRMALQCPDAHVIHLDCLLAVDERHLAACPHCFEG